MWLGWEKHVDLWTWGIKWARHYRWMAGTGCIDRTPKLIKPIQENVQWLRQPVHSVLMIPWVVNDKSTAICHVTTRQVGAFVTTRILIPFICSPCGCYMILQRLWWRSGKLPTNVTVDKENLNILCAEWRIGNRETVWWRCLLWETVKVRTTGDVVCELAITDHFIKMHFLCVAYKCFTWWLNMTKIRYKCVCFFISCALYSITS